MATEFVFPRFNGYGSRVGIYTFSSADMYKAYKNTIKEKLESLRRRKEQGIMADEWLTDFRISWERYQEYRTIYFKDLRNDENNSR